ncbi:MFS transporter [Marinomonas ostreistagni]|uniref:MFS transporter n=1 Tax=Marinomonas ostreistagni TaxID=359209 RepID=UPI001952636C|nr:MFS transporter [Marinomonas ostreistagni]MBM6550403.1 MFS transporter [Marinomonas ostreistagni]
MSEFNETQGAAAPEVSANWSGVFAMTLCAFLMVAAEFMPVSLLTPMAAELMVTEGAVGQGIAISGLCALLVALSVSSLTRKLDRKLVLLGLTAVMFVSSLLVALATNYIMYMAGRALVGVALGGFWSMSAAAAMRLVPAEKVPKALAVFNGGNALAMVLAAPLGSLLGALVSWRGAFFFLVPVALAAFIWQWVSLPSMASDGKATKLHHIFRPMKRLEVAVGFCATALLFMGQFTLYTYIRPFLEIETGVSESVLTVVLLMIGVAGFIGTTLISRFLGKGLFYTLMIMPIILAICAVLLIELGAQQWVVMPVLFVWGLIATSAPVGWWTWVAKTMPDDAEAGGGLMVAIVQLAIGLGSTVGGVLFDLWGYETAFAVAGLLLLMSGVMALGARSINHRQVQQPA